MRRIAPLVTLTITLVAIPVVAPAAEPTCPAGWRTAASEYTHMPRRPGDFAGYPRKTISVNVPENAKLMPFSPADEHPKFCWKDTNTPWECHYTDPWEGAHFRFDTWKTNQPSGVAGFRRYSIVAQNESDGEERTAQLLLCYQSRTN